MILEVGKAVYDILSNELSSKMKNKIFPLVADNKTEFPFIVYKRLNIVPADTKDKYIYNSTAMVEITVAATNYNESIEIADKVITAMIGKKGNYGGIEINNIMFYDATEDFIEDTFIQTITLKIYIN